MNILYAMTGKIACEKAKLDCLKLKRESEVCFKYSSFETWLIFRFQVHLLWEKENGERLFTPRD